MYWKLRAAIQGYLPISKTIASPKHWPVLTTRLPLNTYSTTTSTTKKMSFKLFFRWHQKHIKLMLVRNFLFSLLVHSFNRIKCGLQRIAHKFHLRMHSKRIIAQEVTITRPLVQFKSIFMSSLCCVSTTYVHFLTVAVGVIIFQNINMVIVRWIAMDTCWCL